MTKEKKDKPKLVASGKIWKTSVRVRVSTIVSETLLSRGSWLTPSPHANRTERNHYLYLPDSKCAHSPISNAVIMKITGQGKCKLKNLGHQEITEKTLEV